MDHGLTVAVKVDGDDLLRSPVSEPETALVPARRLAERDPAHQDSSDPSCLDRARHMVKSAPGCPHQDRACRRPTGMARDSSLREPRRHSACGLNDRLPARRLNSPPARPGNMSGRRRCSRAASGRRSGGDAYWNPGSARPARSSASASAGELVSANSEVYGATGASSARRAVAALSGRPRAHRS